MNLERGEIITLDDKEYVCFQIIKNEGINYIYLMSNFKPIEVLFVKEVSSGEEMKVEVINDAEEKNMVLKMFKDMAK